MRIFLRGGKFNGRYDDTEDADREFVKDGQSYTMVEQITYDGAFIFEFDEAATEEHAGIHARA